MFSGFDIIERFPKWDKESVIRIEERGSEDWILPEQIDPWDWHGLAEESYRNKPADG